MASDAWSAELTARVAEQIRTARTAAGLTVAQTADACAALGVPVPKTTITNLELGRRASVDLAEFLVLARALDVPPITLLFPLGKAATVELVPGQSVSTWEALAWFTGEAPAADAPAPEGSAQHLLDTFRAHSDAVATAAASTRLAKERRRKATAAPDPARRAALLEAAAAYEALAAEDCRELRDFRRRMTGLGLVPPPLPEALASVDEVADVAGEDG
ncbi:helix-turn-helix transcriptional regulator [Streptomyces durbertensis]|uniref:Helix-turn-helix transcriptional regulator n=1 Tax=Streptomyces durbertensis TaxID=2448886 RepID=A0ABR6EAY8_9ACTN|nr:helix-turn-helix transcriptional regulator [Streptomyces durbertensis]MBB1242500.1 helix-turn-helix transcriptional regulator [Streptomyces durbertensis]